MVLDLSEAIAGANKYRDDDPKVHEIVKQINLYADTSAVKPPSLVRSAKLELFLRKWREENDVDAMAIQCWTSIQANYGVCSCTTMSRLGDEGVPCACESDIIGTLSMHACMLASGSPAGLADWNNLHNNDDELANIWHCGVFPKSFAKTPIKLGVQEIIASSGGARYEDSEGTVEFIAKPSPLTLCRATQSPEGQWKAVIAHGTNRRQSGGDFRRLRLVPHSQPAAAVSRHTGKVFPPSRGHNSGARGQRAVGGLWQLPGHGSVSRHPRRAGPVHAAPAVLNDK